NPILSKNELRFVMSFPSRHASRTHKWQPTRQETILSFTEHDKRLLHNRLSDTIGPEEADILMEHLPPAGWSHLATKDDITLSGAVLRTEVAELRTELKTEIAELRTELKTEISELRTELKTEIAAVRTELKTEIAELRTELKTEISDLRVELKTEIAAVRAELKSEIATVKTDMSGLRVEMERGFRSQTWKMVTAMIASQGISVAIMAAMVNSLR
ncbi:MAG: DUF1640 domain-containing protein, partial [Actinobacteria bacterium]|nr:DUF1640 domain-containing protein [Actinomycetota bacterium]